MLKNTHDHPPYEINKDDYIQSHFSLESSF